MALRETCLWEHLTPSRPDRAALKDEVKVDVCVIGAGITGLSAAVHLLEQGKSVAVLEAHRTGHGGSGRNVGLVNAGMWIPPDEIEAGFGEAVGSQLNRMLGAAPSLVFSLIDKYNIDCQLRREGTLHMAHNARGEADLRSREAQWKRRGAPVELLTGQACEQATGTKKIAAALLDRRAGTLNPMAYTSGLANAAAGLGGQLFDHSPVTQLERQGSHWSVQTAQGSVQAAQVVIASNAYTEGEWTELRRNFFPGYYYQVASTPLTPAGARGPAFLVGKNFRTILRYNNSTNYALAVALLSQRLSGGPGVVAEWPRDLQPLSREQTRQLQAALNAKGFDTGTPDGVLGPATRAGLRKYQQSQGLLADGYPTLELLHSLAPAGANQ